MNAAGHRPFQQISEGSFDDPFSVLGLHEAGGKQSLTVYHPDADEVEAIDLKTGAVTGFEALARWRHPEQGLIPPQGFLPLFEAQGLLDDLDIMILDAVIEDTRSLRALGLSPKRVSVNMSGALLHRHDLLDVFRSRAPFGFNLVIELSEAVSYESLDETTRFNIDCLREMGCEFEVDDFGSAQASILGVIGLRPDRLKIDKGLILPMLESEQNTQIVKAILEIAHALNIPVIAEGVETQAHATALQKMGCDAGQGYVFGPPLHLSDLPNFMRGRDKERALRKG